MPTRWSFEAALPDGVDPELAKELVRDLVENLSPGVDPRLDRAELATTEVPPGLRSRLRDFLLGSTTELDRMWLGLTRGKWVIQAFGVEEHASHWAAKVGDHELDGDRIVIGPFAVPDDVDAWRGTIVPAAHQLRPL